MSNETANRSHAGLVLQMFAAPDPPRLLASWGFVASSLMREAALGVGIYSIRLEQPASGLIGPTAALFETIDSVILTSILVAEPVFFIQTILLPDPALPLPGVGDIAQLPVLAISLVNDVQAAEDGDALLQLELRAVPQQT